MLNARTLIITLLSLFVALVAVKGYSVMTREAPPVPKTIKTAEPKPEKPVTIHTPFSQTVPKGKRVVTIKVNEVTGATRAVEKNDRVDIIAVTDVRGASRGKIARVILQNVVIYDIEQAYFKRQITDKAARAKKDWTLQLLVSLDQALTLSTVDEAARLRLVLRNPEDTRITQTTSLYYSPETGMSAADKAAPNSAAQIRPGFRAISLAVDNSDGICGRLNPGDRVDVIVSFKLSLFSTSQGNLAEGTQAKVTKNRKSSKIILQNIPVLSTGPVQDPFSDRQKTIRQVSLMVTPTQAERLAVITDASKESQIRLILRNPDDRTTVQTRGEMFSDQVLTDKRNYRVIDTVRGNTVHPRKFYE